MKFIIHNLRMIFSRWRNNGWVLGELFLVFIVMWYLCDSLGCLKYIFNQPLGYDIEHVYRLDVSMGGESADPAMSNAAKHVALANRLSKMEGIEAVGMCYWSLPMSGNNSYNSLNVTDSIGISMRYIRCTEGYMKVFRFREDPQRPFAQLSVDENSLMLSRGAYEAYSKKYPSFSLDTSLGNGGEEGFPMRVKGVIDGFREYRYGADTDWYFKRIDDNLMLDDKHSSWEPNITFRVKSQADGPDYRQYFLDEIAPKLDIDNLFVVDAVPYILQQEEFEVLRGDTDRVNTHTVIVIFLLVNVFLGLVGTFWLRTRRRRGEIALRLSMGSSRAQIGRLLIGEGLLLLTLVAVPAAVVCYNVAISEPTLGNSALISLWPVEWSFLRFMLGTLAAWLLIAIMVVTGIWFPARQAMQIQPAEALHEE